MGFCLVGIFSGWDLVLPSVEGSVTDAVPKVRSLVFLSVETLRFHNNVHGPLWSPRPVVSPLSVLSAPEDREAHMYRVDIYLPPKEGRDENADILEIKTTVEGLSDIKVLFSFKELGNSVVILVLRVDKACSWPQLTSFLARKVYEVKVTPMYYCSDFARELGLNMTRDFYDTSLPDDEDLIIGKQIFHVKDLTTTQYDAMLKLMFEREMSILNAGQRATCFRTLAGLPEEMTHFAPVRQKKMSAISETMKAHSHFDFELLRIQKLDHYTGGCE